MSGDTPFYAPNQKRAPLGVGQPGEKRYAFVRARDRKYFRCELRFNGESYG